MNFIQISDTQGVNLDRITDYSICGDGKLRLFDDTDRSGFVVDDPYRAAVFKRVGYVAPGDCSYCFGKGVDREIGEPCGACQGTGLAIEHERPIGDHYAKCDECGGTGQVPYDS